MVWKSGGQHRARHTRLRLSRASRMAGTATFDLFLTGRLHADAREAPRERRVASWSFGAGPVRWLKHDTALASDLPMRRPRPQARRSPSRSSPVVVPNKRSILAVVRPENPSYS